MPKNNIKTPRKAKLIIRDCKEYDIVKIHFNTNLVTLREATNLYNTVSIRDVIFNFDGLTKEDIDEFEQKFSK